jgi:hypothetical protein
MPRVATAMSRPQKNWAQNDWERKRFFNGDKLRNCAEGVEIGPRL